MIVTIPYNPSLQTAYDKLVGSVLRFGKHPNHTLFVTSMAKHEEGAFELAMKLREHFGRYFAITVPDQPESSLQESNRLFTASLDNLRSYKCTENDKPCAVMLYFDPLWRPTKVRWLDEFQADYNLAGTPTTFGDFITLGEKGYVRGPVAISSKFLNATKLLEFMPRNIHWRDYLAWEIINNGVRAEALGKTSPAYIRPFDP